MILPPKTQNLSCAAAPLSPVVSPANEKGQAVGRMPSDSAELSRESRRRPLPQSFDLPNVQRWGSSQKHRSSAMQPQSGLVKEVKTEILGVALDSIQGGKCKGLPHNAGVQGRIVSPSIQEEGKQRKMFDPSNQSTCTIDANFLQQVVVAFEEVNTDQEGSTRLAKEAISTNPTFLAILAKYGNITKDFLLDSGPMLTLVLKVICEVVQDLQKKRLTEVDRDLLDSYYLVVKDAEKVKVNVNWLRTRLDEIRDAINCIFDTKKVNDERNRRAKQNEIEKKNLESKKAELEKLKSETERQERA
ncbi:unnamed protein product [Withania somnifera]